MTVHTSKRADGGQEAVTVVAWRRHRLLEAGFDDPLAVRLAATPGVDLHELLDLVHHGCPPELAARILSPLSEPVAPPGPLS
jgi:hypothetical protein